MPRLTPRQAAACLLIGSLIAGPGCGGSGSADVPVDKGKNADLQKAMGNYMNKVSKSPSRKK